MAGAVSRQLATEVEDRKVQLMHRNPDLTEREAFLAAASAICKEKPELLQAYRSDTSKA